MSVTNIRVGASARGALLYQLYGLGPEGTQRRKAGDHRAVGFISDYGHSPNSAVWAHIRDAERVGRSRRARSEALTLIHSFPKEEMDPQNPEDIQRVGELGYELAKRLYPNSAVTVVVHNDSKGQNLHSHITVTNEDMETGKAIRANKLHRQVQKVNDELMRDHGLTVTEPQADKVNQFMYWQGVRNAQKAHELEEEELTPEQHIWNQFEKALTNEHVTDFDSFKAEMDSLGVEVRFKERRGEITAVTYGFTTDEGKTKAYRGKTLGPQYTAEGLKDLFNLNKERQTAQDDRYEAETRLESAERERESLVSAVRGAKESARTDGERILHTGLEHADRSNEQAKSALGRFRERLHEARESYTRELEELARANRTPRTDNNPTRKSTVTKTYRGYSPSYNSTPKHTGADRDFGPEL